MPSPSRRVRCEWYCSAVCWYRIAKADSSIIKTRILLAVPSSRPPIQNFKQDNESEPKSFLYTSHTLGRTTRRLEVSTCNCFFRKTAAASLSCCSTSSARSTGTEDGQATSPVFYEVQQFHQRTKIKVLKTPYSLLNADLKLTKTKLIRASEYSRA